MCKGGGCGGSLGVGHFWFVKRKLKTAMRKSISIVAINLQSSML